MTNYLMDPVRGQTTYKIDSQSTASSSILWPSSKMALPDDTLFGAGGALLSTGIWSIVYDGASIQNTPPVTSDGLYQISVRHETPGAFALPIVHKYRINAGPTVEIGYSYYQHYTDMSAFVSLKQGDTVQFLGTVNQGGYTLYPTYSRLLEWMIRKVGNAAASDTIFAF